MNTYFLPERTCLWCNKPVEGRADKKFCKSGCKASYNRAQLTADPPSEAQPASRPLTVSRSYSPAVVDWQARCEQAEHILWERDQAELAAEPFEQECDQLEQVLKQYLIPGCSISTLAYLLLQVEQGIERYKQHPALLNPRHAARYRLSNLYMARQAMQIEHRYLFNREKVGKSAD